MEPLSDALKAVIEKNVADALREDVGDGDLTAALVAADDVTGASIIARQRLTVAGQAWVDAVFRQLDDSIVVDWYIGDGQTAEADDILCKLVGNSRALLSGERTALNFLQTLSATATTTAAYVAAVRAYETRLLDTRKTIPGLRLAQKYAVSVGGGHNHRIGLFDAILIKENHIKAAGGIAEALAAVNVADDILVEIEVESLEELQIALDAGAGRILLDNFSNDDLRKAVEINKGMGYVAAELEASGNVTLATVAGIAASGVDYISTGALTKNIEAVDLSMLFRIN